MVWQWSPYTFENDKHVPVFLCCEHSGTRWNSKNFSNSSTIFRHNHWDSGSDESCKACEWHLAHSLFWVPEKQLSKYVLKVYSYWRWKRWVV